MTDDHFDVFDDHDTDMGRHCRHCGVDRHGDCRPHGCAAQQTGGRREH